MLKYSDVVPSALIDSTQHLTRDPIARAKDQPNEPKQVASRSQVCAIHPAAATQVIPSTSSASTRAGMATAQSPKTSTPVRVPKSVATYSTASEDPSLRSQINTMLLRDGHITRYVWKISHTDALLKRKPVSQLTPPSMHRTISLWDLADLAIAFKTRSSTPSTTLRRRGRR